MTTTGSEVFDEYNFNFIVMTFFAVLYLNITGVSKNELLVSLLQQIYHYYGLFRINCFRIASTDLCNDFFQQLKPLGHIIFFRCVFEFSIFSAFQILVLRCVMRVRRRDKYLTTNSTDKENGRHELTENTCESGVSL